MLSLEGAMVLMVGVACKVSWILKKLMTMLIATS